MGLANRCISFNYFYILIFGAVLNAGEAGQSFMNLAIASSGHLKVVPPKSLSSRLRFWFNFWICICQCGLHGNGYVTDDAALGLSKKRVAGAVGGGIDRRANHASTDGCGSVHYGRVNWYTVYRYHSCRLDTALLFYGMDWRKSLR